MVRIFHVATVADWAAAQEAGRYTTSTRGRTLAEEGFVHAARADQWQDVRERYYADVTEPLVLLVIDTDLLSAPVVEEPAGADTFPHVYGAIEAAAVVQALPLDPVGSAHRAHPDPTPAATPETRTPNAPRTMSSLYLEELAVRAGAGVAVIVVAVGIGLVVLALAGDAPGLVTMLVLLVVGAGVAVVVLRRRDRRLAREAHSRR